MHTAQIERDHIVIARAASGPPPHLRDVLYQLAAGVTDECASRRLGLSPRTFSRRVSELLEMLGVSSRFQAGVKAERLGWLRIRS